MDWVGWSGGTAPWHNFSLLLLLLMTKKMCSSSLHTPVACPSSSFVLGQSALCWLCTLFNMQHEKQMRWFTAKNISCSSFWPFQRIHFCPCSGKFVLISKKMMACAAQLSNPDKIMHSISYHNMGTGKTIKLTFVTIVTNGCKMPEFWGLMGRDWNYIS